jgi:hypothetical protein
LNPLKSLEGDCGCDRTEDDYDGDGEKDCFDPCPTDATKTSLTAPTDV